MNNEHSKRNCLLPKGCKDLGDILKLKEQKKKRNAAKVLRTNEEIREVFRKFVPEIAAGTVEIVSLARNVGRRCLLAVRSHDPKVSLKVCSFERGPRLNAIVAELGGELPSVVLWDPTPDQLIRNAFPLNVVLDSVSRHAVVTMRPEERNLIMVGKKDQLVRMYSEMAGLVSELSGWKVTLAGQGE